MKIKKYISSMENNDKKGKDVQGTDKTATWVETIDKEINSTKKQKTSKSYLIRSLGIAIKKLEETGLSEEKDLKELREIHKRATEKYINEMTK